MSSTLVGHAGAVAARVDAQISLGESSPLWTMYAYPPHTATDAGRALCIGITSVTYVPLTFAGSNAVS